jgi:hypothetical protein
MDAFLASLRRIRRRVLAVRAVEAGLAGAVAGAELAAVVTVIRILLPEHTGVVATYPALPLALLPAGFLVGALWRLAGGVSLRETARVADTAAGLQERLTTAIEVLEHKAPVTPGLLDERLLDQARAAASAIDPKQLKLGRSMTRSAKVVAAAVLVLVVGAMIPAMGGPAVPAPAAERASGALQQMAAETDLSPAVRAAVEKAVSTLQQSGLRQQAADQATSAVLDAMNRQQQARADITAALAKSENADLRDLARAIQEGDLAAARKIAARLGLKLESRPETGGLPPSEREHVAAGLSGAAAVARTEDLVRLAEEMEAAAAAVRAGQAEAAEVLRRAAEEMALSLRPPSPEDVAAVAQARKVLGLPAVNPAPPVVAGVPVQPVAPATGSEGPPAIEAAASPAIHPEDREVVRKYFQSRK